MRPWTRAAVTLALLGALALLVPWSELWRHAGGLEVGVWLGVFGVILASHALGVLKWRLAVNAGRARLRALDAVQCYGAGLFANMCLPSIIGGDALRAVLAGRLTRRYEAVVFGGVADRLLDVAALVALAACGAAFSHQDLPPVVTGVLYGAAALGLLGAASVALVLRRAPPSRWPSRWARAWRRLLVAARRLGRRPALAAQVGLAALAIQATFALLHAWLGHAVGIDVPLALWFLAFPLAKIASLLPISLAGFGVREASLAGVLLAASVPAEQGVLVALVWGSMLIATGLAGGAVWFALGLRRQARTGAGHGSLLAAATGASRAAPASAAAPPGSSRSCAAPSRPGSGSGPTRP